MVSLGEGMTPLLPMPAYGKRAGLSRLLMKDEGLVPTGTFKARGAAVGVSRAAELGVTGVAMPTNGNAGAAWALYAARAGMESLIAMPDDAPRDHDGRVPGRRAPSSTASTGSSATRASSSPPRSGSAPATRRSPR